MPNNKDWVKHTAILYSQLTSEYLLTWGKVRKLRENPGYEENIYIIIAKFDNFLNNWRQFR